MNGGEAFVGVGGGSRALVNVTPLDWPLIDDQEGSLPLNKASAKYNNQRFTVVDCDLLSFGARLCRFRGS